MSVEQIQYEEDILRVSFRDRRIYGEADHYYDGVVPYSQIPTLRTYNPQWEQQWEDAVNEGASTSTTYQDFWIPQVEQHIRYASVFGSVYHARGGGDGTESTHGPFRIDLPTPPSITLINASQFQLLTGSLMEAAEELFAIVRNGKKSLHELNAQEFELLVGAILRNHDYVVEFTKCTKDGGYDVFAIRENPLGLDLRMIVECKRYRRDRPVGVSIVRQVWGVMEAPSMSIDRGIIATTSNFSKDAQQLLASSWRLSGWDHDQIMGFIGFRKTANGLWLPT
jgi:hypothetical protein